MQQLQKKKKKVYGPSFLPCFTKEAPTTIYSSCSALFSFFYFSATHRRPSPDSNCTGFKSLSLKSLSLSLSLSLFFQFFEHTNRLRTRSARTSPTATWWSSPWTRRRAWSRPSASWTISRAWGSSRPTPSSSWPTRRISSGPGPSAPTVSCSSRHFYNMFPLFLRSCLLEKIVKMSIKQLYVMDNLLNGALAKAALIIRIIYG